MQPSLQTAPISAPTPMRRQRRQRQTGDLAYQGVIVAAILVLLGSMF